MKGDFFIFFLKISAVMVKQCSKCVAENLVAFIGCGVFHCFSSGVRWVHGWFQCFYCGAESAKTPIARDFLIKPCLKLDKLTKHHQTQSNKPLRR